MKTTIILLTLPFILGGCHHKQPPPSLTTYNIEYIFDTEDKVIHLDDISSGIDIIPLETADHILINEIIKIHLHKNLLFVQHEKRCSVFDLDGAYLWDIGKKGNGPRRI